MIMTKKPTPWWKTAKTWWVHPKVLADGRRTGGDMWVWRRVPAKSGAVMRLRYEPAVLPGEYAVTISDEGWTERLCKVKRDGTNQGWVRLRVVEG